ncbi:MAG: DapH/DapD/GlmU-related protein [Steroidobacteraceae bacterium]
MLRRIWNRFLHRLARSSPGSETLRPQLHRWRGVRIGTSVFIGDDVYLENEYPDRVEIQDNVQISIRAIIIAHTRGPGRVVVERDAFIGPNSVLICGAGSTLRIGRGAVIGAGSVITRSVPAGYYVSPPPPVPIATVGVPLPLAKTMDEFRAGLKPIRRPRSS